ncbi:MAG: CDP-alcohol phosphatidyltransferase family protein [Catonella sp.]|uniref:CDP-alcohol phosphatidyltransferase family protein n=1 Tax=Catonella sp. TaxID=2382125 RepID=UPI003FA0A461
MKKGLLGYYNYTVVLTYLGMLSAFVGILMIFEYNLSVAVVCLMVAGVCDMFDGMVAATKERDDREKRFGIQIDSLSDLISFGVFPALFVYSLPGYTILSGVLASFYLLAALIRLAYFNVLEEERQRETTKPRTIYFGLPVTTIAISLPAVYILSNMEIIPGVIDSKVIYLVLLAIVMCGFLSPFQLKKPKTFGKIVIVAIGLLEVIGIIFLMGWH